MNPKPFALPRPPEVESALEGMLTAEAAPGALLDSLMSRRAEMVLELGRLEGEIERAAIESICGGQDDTQDVELYDGSLGVSRAFCDEHEPRVGQLQWLNDLAQRFNKPGESPGNVSGQRWGSGGLFANDLFITAGHCFDRDGNGWERPSRNGVVITSQEIATLMQVNFNYQRNGQTFAPRPGEPFPVTELLEFRLAGLDFAIVRLGPNAAGQLPGEKYGVLALAAQDLTTANAMLALIQHPAGKPKMIEAGPMAGNSGGRISYGSLDTLGGSSGAPILAENGELVGVHTNGGCSQFSGANFGVAIGVIRSASSIIQ